MAVELASKAGMSQREGGQRRGVEGGGMWCGSWSWSLVFLAVE